MECDTAVAKATTTNTHRSTILEKQPIIPQSFDYGSFIITFELRTAYPFKLNKPMGS